MAIIRLTIRPGRMAAGSDTPRFLLNVDTNDLAPAQNGITTIKADAGKINHWANRASYLPRLLWNGADNIKIDAGVVINPPIDFNWRRYGPGNLDLTIHGTGRMTGNGTNRNLELLTGSVRLWSRLGFELVPRFINNFPNYQQWRESIWPEDRQDIAAVVFGSTSVAVEVRPDETQLNQPRRRLVLQRESPTHRLWRLESCYPQSPTLSADDIRTPEAIVDERRKVFFDLIGPPGFGDRLRIEDRPALDASGPEVFYLSTRTTADGSVREFSRPRFDVIFRDEDRSSAWTPQTLEVKLEGSGVTTFTLHDFDAVGRLRTSDELPNEPAQECKIQWSMSTDPDHPHPATTALTCPPLAATGSRPALATGEYLWQYAAVSPALPGSEVRPGWIRHQIPDPGPTRVVPRTRSLTGPLPVGGIAGGWSLEMIPAENETATTVSFAVKKRAGSTTTVTLRTYAAGVTALSPPLWMYASPLPAGPAVPAVKTLERENGASLLVSARLQFAVVPPRGSGPRLALEFNAAGTSADLVPDGGAITVWHPYRHVALVEPVSAGAPNLRQVRDAETGRTVIDRDPTHGLTGWSLPRFRFNGNQTLETVVGGVAAPLRAQLHGAMATAPWVLCEDSPAGSANRRSLHHRNLILEPGEFAAAGADRFAGGRVDGIAANLTDFLEAVRDPYTIAAADLKAAPSPPSKLVHWCPGAVLREDLRVRLQLPAGTPPLHDRWPKLKLQPIDQTLQVLYRDATHPPSPPPHHWLTFDLRWITTAVRPQFEVRAPQQGISGRWSRTRNGSVPLLFDGTAMTAAALTEFGAAEAWFVAGDAAGALVVSDHLRRRELARRDLGEAAIAVKAAEIAGTRFVTAVGARGRFLAWDAAFDPISVTLPPAPTVDAALEVIGNGILIAALQVEPPQDGALRLWLWNPAAASDVNNPSRIDANLPHLTVDDASWMAVTPDATGFWIALSHPAQSAVVRAIRNGQAWTYSTFNFPAPTGAIALEASNGLTIATLAPDGLSYQLWTVTGAALTPLPTGNRTLTAAAVRVAVGRGEMTAAEIIVAVADASGNVDVRWGAMHRDASGIVDVSWSAMHRTFRPHAGAIAAMMCQNATYPASHDGTGVRRSVIVSAADDGTAAVWDVEAAAVRQSISTRRQVYDNLGALRSVTVSETMTRPGLKAEPVDDTAPGVDPNSTYAGPDGLIVLTLDPENAFRCISGDAQDRTSIYMSFTAMRLRRASDGRWHPDRGRVDPADPLRPQLALSVSRGDPGTYCSFARALATGPPSGSAALDTMPRLAGVPIHVTKLDWITFATSRGRPDFSQPTGMAFEAVLPDPRRLPPTAGPDEIARAVEAAWSSGARITVVLQAGGSADFVLDSVSHAQPLVWDLEPGDSPAAVPGQLVRLTASARLAADSATGRPTLLLDLDPDKCAVEVLNGRTALRDRLTLQSGVTPDGGFGFETLRNDPVGQSILPFNLGTAVRRFRPNAVVIAASDEGLLVAAETTRISTYELATYELATAAPLSRSTLNFAPRHVAAGNWPAPLLVALAGRGCHIHDPHLDAQYRPGRPDPSAGTEVADVPDAILSGTEFTAGFVTPETGEIFLGEADGRISTWNAVTGSLVESLDVLAGVVSALAVDPNFVAAAEEGSRRIVLLNRTTANGLVLYTSKPTATPAPVHRMSLATNNVANTIGLVAVSRTAIAAWTIPIPATGRNPQFNDVSLPAVEDALAFDQDFLIVTASEVKFLNSGTVVDPAPGGRSRVAASRADNGRRIVVVAGGGFTTRVWIDPGTDTWTVVTPDLQIPVAAEVSSINITYWEGEFHVTISGDASDPVETWRVGTAVPINVATLNGLLAGGGVIDVPHAAVCRPGGIDLIDLSRGKVRLTLTTETDPKSACFIADAGTVKLLARGPDSVTAFSADASVVYTAPHEEPLHTLAVHGTQALMAGATKAIVWDAATAPVGVAPIEPAAVTSRAALYKTFVAFAGVPQAGTTTVQVYDLADTITPRTEFSVEGLRSVVLLEVDGTIHAAIGEDSGLTVYTLPEANGVASARWRVPGILADHVEIWAPVSGPHLVAIDATTVGVWPFDRRLTWRNDDEPVIGLALKRATGGASVLDVRLGLKGETGWTLTEPGEDPKVLRAETTFRGVTGFVGVPLAGAWGQFPVLVGRNQDGDFEGSVVREFRIAALQVVLLHQQTTLATADLIVLESRTFAVSATRVVTGEVRANLADGTTLKLLLSEQKLTASGTAFGGTILAHMKFVSNAFEVEGPVPLAVDWTTSRLRLTFPDGVYRLAPVEPALPSDATLSDILVPGESTLLAYNVFSPTPHPNYRSGFVRMQPAHTGFEWHQVADVQLPFDVCFDRGVTEALAVQPAEVPQLAHRQVLGPRLRYRPATDLLLAVPDSPPSTWQPNYFRTTTAPNDTVPRWLAAPVLGATVRDQRLAVTTGTAELQRTENILLVNPAETLALSNHTSAASGPLLAKDVIQAALVSHDVIGVAVHRVQTENRPSRVRILDRPARRDRPAAPDVQFGRPVDRPDFRCLDPRGRERLLSWQFRDQEQYRPEPLEYDADLDAGARAWRRWRCRDIAAPVDPPRDTTGERAGLLLDDRTAFHRMEPAAIIPAVDDVFADADAEQCFLPRVLEYRLAEDKPGAMQHHRMRVLSDPVAGEAVVALGAPFEFALREPMQITPPAGADIEILTPPQRRGISARGSEVWSFEWRETLAALSLGRLGNSTSVVQVGVTSTTPRELLPPPEDVTVTFASPQFVRCFVRLNDEFFEIDERMPQYPVYDARVSAWDPRTLTEKDAAYRGGQPRPDLQAPATTLDALAGDEGLILLAGDGAALKRWRIPGAAGGDVVPGSIGVLVRLNEHLFVFSNSNADGTDGLTLHSVAGGPSMQVGTVANDFALAWRQVPPARAEDPAQDILIAISPTQIRLWAVSADATTSRPQSFTITCTPESLVSVAATPGNLHIALGGNSDVLSLTIEVSSLSISATTNDQVPGLTAMTFGVMEEQVELFTATDTGLHRRRWDAGRLIVVADYEQNQPAVVGLAFGLAAGRPIVSAVLEDGGVQLRDALTGRILRTVAADPGSLFAVTHVGGQLRLALSDGSGKLQVYNPRLTPVRPPETFLVSSVANLLDDVPLTLRFQINGTEDAVTVDFVPKLILDDRLRPDAPQRYDLRDVLDSPSVAQPGTGHFIWTFKTPDGTSNGPQWERASSWRIVWTARFTADGADFDPEAGLFAPLVRKAIRPVPYAAVAPKLAAVAILDGTGVERLQQSLLFGDAATAAGGAPDLTGTIGAYVLRYRSTDREHVELPLPLPLGAIAARHLLLIHTSVNGQVIATAATVH